MEKDLLKFENSVVYMGNKDICLYTDANGNYMLINIGALLESVSYEELNETQYNNTVFEGRIDKNLKYNEIEVKRKTDKSTVTGKKKDMGTIVDKIEKVKQVWTVTNGLRAMKTYQNKEEAIKHASLLNMKYLDWMGIKEDK